MSKNVVVTGANRGIGLSFCRYYAQHGYQVYALCRHSSEALEQLGVNVVKGIDVREPGCAPAVKEALRGVTLHLLINNAGILSNESLGNINREQIEQQFLTNALGPLVISDALYPQMPAGSKLALISSRMGSMADNGSGGYYGYRMSKAALNAAGVSLAQDLRPLGIAVAILHPGLVGTEMIGGHGDLTPDQAAERLAERIAELDLDNSGYFRHSNGEVLPW